MDSEFKKHFLFLSFMMLLFLAFRIIQGDFRLQDSEDYFAVAELLKNGDYFSFTSNFDKAALVTKRPFLYPLLILFPGFLNDLIIVLVQTALGIFNIYLILKLFKELGGKSFKLLSLLLLLTTSVFIYTHLIMTEALVMTLFLLLAQLLTKQLNSKKIFWIQVIITALLFLKPAFYLFAIVNLLFFIVYFIRTKTFYFTVLIPLTLTIGYMAFNKERTGYFHFSSMQNINLIDYNLHLFKAQKEGVAVADEWKEAIYDRSLSLPNFKERSEFLALEGKKTIKENLVPYSVFHLYGAVRGTIDPGRFDIMTFAGKYNPEDGFLNKLSTTSFKETINGFFEYKYFWTILILIPIFFAGLLKWILIFSFLWKKRNTINFRNSYLFLLISYSILITGPVNASRYMMPLQGILIVIAIIGRESFRQKKAPQSSEAF